MTHTSVIGYKDLTTFTNLHNLLIDAGWTHISRIGRIFTYRKMGKDGFFHFFKLVDENPVGVKFENDTSIIYICDCCGKTFDYAQEGFHDSTDGTCLCGKCCVD